MNKMSVSDTSEIAFISRSSKNNGLVAFVDKFNETEPLQPGLITVTLGGTYVLASFLQEIPFYTAQNVAVLKSRMKISKEQKLYYCMTLHFQSHMMLQNSKRKYLEKNLMLL